MPDLGIGFMVIRSDIDIIYFERNKNIQIMMLR